MSNLGHKDFYQVDFTFTHPALTNTNFAKVYISILMIFYDNVSSIHLTVQTIIHAILSEVLGSVTNIALNKEVHTPSYKPVLTFKNSK